MCCFLIFGEDAIYMHVRNRGLENISYIFDMVPEKGD